MLALVALLCMATLQNLDQFKQHDGKSKQARSYHQAAAHKTVDRPSRWHAAPS